MKVHVDLKSVVIGFLLAGVVFLGLGTARIGPREVVGRFQIACTDTLCFVVDTVTGQVWTSQQKEFLEPKIKTVAAEIQAEAGKAFVGAWRTVDGQDPELTIRLDADGGVLATEVGDDDEYPGSWRMDGDRVVINVDEEEYTAEMTSGGRMILHERDGDDEYVFERDSAAVEEVTNPFLGRWEMQGDDVELLVKAGGAVDVIEEGMSQSGKWSADGDEIVIDIDDSVARGEIGGDGNLTVREEGGDRRMVFEKSQN